MRARIVVALGVFAVMFGGSSEKAGAAVARDCPSECRPEYNDVMCKKEEVRNGERVTITYYFWSDGTR